MIRKYRFRGSPFIGIFAVTSNKVTVIPPGDEGELLAEVLKTQIVHMNVAASGLVGSYISMNDHGIALPYIATENIKDIFKNAGIEDCNVVYIKDRLTALGNDILLNSRKAIVHPDFSNKNVRLMQDVFDVEIMKSSIGEMKTVGSVAVATDKGVLVHPNVSDDEIDNIKKFFNLPVKRMTANYGSIYLGAGIVANANGALIGEDSSVIEVSRLEDALDLIE